MRWQGVGDERDALRRSSAAFHSVAVLLGERDQRAVGLVVRAAAPGVGEQHQRQQAGDLAVVGQQRVHGPRQPDGFSR